MGRPGASLASPVHFLSVGKTGSMNQPPQKPPQHTPAPAGKTLWFDSINSACTNMIWVPECTFQLQFLNLLKTRIKACAETRWDTCPWCPSPWTQKEGTIRGYLHCCWAGSRAQHPCFPAPLQLQVSRLWEKTGRLSPHPGSMLEDVHQRT